jgi:hypothetical protein
MNKFLPSIINTLSNNSQSAISSIIKEIKSSKQDISSLISRLNSFRAEANFSPANFSALSEMNKQVFIDIFRDADLRTKSYYSSVNVVNLFINSIIDVFSSEIEKIEKDIQALESYIDNYEYISGKDDLFNSNYVEKFDNFMNDYRADGYTFPLSDRDNIFFSESGDGFIDTKLGLFKIGEKTYTKNSLGFIQNYSIVSNYENYVTTDTGFSSVLNSIYTDSWSVTAKSPVVITSKLSNYSKYIAYPTTNIFGAQTAVEIEFEFPQIMDSIVINGGHGNGLQLLQVVLFSNLDESKFSTNNYSEEFDDVVTIQPVPSDTSTEYGVLSSPRLIDGPTEITFTKKNVNKVILILNQPTYTRTENLPTSTEVNSKNLYNTAKFVKEIKNKNTDKLQSLVYNLFLKKNSYRQTSKNSYNRINDYYSYKYPITNDNMLSSNYQNNYINEKFSADLVHVLPNNLITNLFRSIFINAIGDRGEIFDNPVFVNTDSNVNSIFNFTKPMFLPTQNSNNNIINGEIGAESSFAWKGRVLKELVTQEITNAYEYSFSLQSIDFCETQPSQALKSCFVSKKINFNGYPLAIKSKIIRNDNEFNTLDSKLDLKYPISYELSISNKDIIYSEADWTPVVESGIEKIDSEVLFFDEQTYQANTRFPFKGNAFVLYKNGVLLKPSDYKISDNNSISIFKLEKNSIYSCAYQIDLSLYNVDYVDFFRLNLLDETLKSSSSNGYSNETFGGTDALNRIQLQNIPHINTKDISSAIYSPLIGTIFQGSQAGYTPIKIQMPDGSIAINLTNYTGTKDFPQFGDSNSLYYFIQNGKNIIFNKEVAGEIVVFYDYLADTIRFRLIMRKNVPDTTYSGAVDLVMLKAKTKNYDPYYDKLTKAISSN